MVQITPQRLQLCFRVERKEQKEERAKNKKKVFSKLINLFHLLSPRHRITTVCRNLIFLQLYKNVASLKLRLSF